MTRSSVSTGEVVSTATYLVGMCESAESTRSGPAQSERVAVSESQISAVADLLRSRLGGARPKPVAWDDPHFWNVEASRVDRCQFLAVGNAMNFRFWSLAEGHVIRSGGLVSGEPLRGAMFMWRRLRIAVMRGELSLDAESLSTISAEQFRQAFADDDGTCPLEPGLQDRVSNVRDLGRQLLDRWDGQFANVVDAAHGSLKRFAELAASFRAFDDPVQKLTMVNAIMLTGSGLASFDEPALPGIDYHLVKQAVRQGLVVPSPTIADKLRRRELLDSTESLELRQATMEALLEVAGISGISTATLDNIYWLNGAVCDEHQPACRVESGPACPFEAACARHTEMGLPLELTRHY
jgi:hypothetical protein